MDSAASQQAPPFVDPPVPSEQTSSSSLSLGYAPSDVASRDDDELDMLIFGSDVSAKKCKRQFIEFLMNCNIEGAEMDEASMERQGNGLLYLNKLEEMILNPNKPILELNCCHLKEFNQTLYNQLVKYPAQVIQIFDEGANEVFQNHFPNRRINIHVTPFNMEQFCNIGDIDPENVTKLIHVKGMISRASSIIPSMTEAFFRCQVCFAERRVTVEDNYINEPTVCVTCNRKFCNELTHNRCKYINSQIVKLQEFPSDMSAGQTPCTIRMVAFNKLTDQVIPGDEVYVTGIYTAHPIRVKPKQRRYKATFEPSIEVIHYRKIKKHQSSEKSFNADRLDMMNNLAKDPEIYERLAHSICPQIFEYLDVKKGVLLQLMGGTKKEAPDPKLRHFRSEINILLCGDPGTSKSQILQHVYKLVPKGFYISGKGSSSVGLTAYVTRDVETRRLTLQTGALVMCNGGVCCIDEFDKMSHSTRSVLHEVMEQQTLSIAKAGIVCQLKTKTSILAAANPVASEWNKGMTIIDNVRLPDTLLSRFDLIFLMLDPNTDDYDLKLSDHIMSLWQSPSGQDLIPNDLIKDYIAYANYEIQPKLTLDSRQTLIDSYIELRSECNGKGLITFYPRNLESLIRLGEAHAKIRFSPIVEQKDIFEAARLIREALKLSSTGQHSGRICDISIRLQ